MDNIPTSIKVFIWSLVPITLLGSGLIARELGVGQWLTKVGQALVVTSSPTAPSTQPIIALVAQPTHATLSSVRNTNQIVLAGGHTVRQADLSRLRQQRDQAAQLAITWKRVYEQLQREAADNCRRNQNLRSCVQPGHQEALRYVP